MDDVMGKSDVTQTWQTVSNPWGPYRKLCIDIYIHNLSCSTVRSEEEMENLGRSDLGHVDFFTAGLEYAPRRQERQARLYLKLVIRRESIPECCILTSTCAVCLAVLLLSFSLFLAHTNNNVRKSCSSNIY